MSTSNDRNSGAHRPARYVQRFTVTADEIDDLGHVNNVVYLAWVQDVAAAHWEHATDEAERAAIRWVAVRHEIDYRAAAFVGDALEAHTWVQGWSGVTSERRTEIVRASDGVLLAQARTVWCAVEAGTAKPTRVPPALKQRFQEAVPEGT